MDSETIQERHAREKKELRNAISEMLKNAKDKKAKKEVRVQIQLMEYELAERHEREINTNAVSESNVDEEVMKPSKAQRKRANKEAKQKQRRAELEDETKNMVDYKAMENEALNEKLSKLNLRFVDIPADGHCLYRSIARQVEILEGTVISVEELRRLTAEYITSHPDDFIAFLISEDGEMEDVDSYVSKIVAVERVAWGGEPELVALAASLQRDIYVHSAESPVWKASGSARDTESSTKPLQVSYHKYYFGLGNHYNSVESI